MEVIGNPVHMNRYQLLTLSTSMATSDLSLTSRRSPRALTVHATLTGQPMKATLKGCTL